MKVNINCNPGMWKCPKCGLRQTDPAGNQPDECAECGTEHPGDEPKTVEMVTDELRELIRRLPNLMDTHGKVDREDTKNHRQPAD